MRRLVLIFTHAVALAVGFGLGIYLLPILVATDSPDAAMLEEKAQSALFVGELTRDLRGSDFLHWGEGTISVSSTEIVQQGALAPGPDYKVYLMPSFVEHEDEFEPLKSQGGVVGDVKSFEGFVVEVPAGVDVSAYNTVVVWCESFAEFITATRYQ